MVNIYNSNFQIFQLRVNTKFYIFWQNVNSIFLLFGQRKVWLVKMWNKKKTSTKCLWVIKTLILLKQLGKENIWPSSLFKYMLKYSCHFTVKFYHKYATDLQETFQYVSFTSELFAYIFKCKIIFPVNISHEKGKRVNLLVF